MDYQKSSFNIYNRFAAFILRFKVVFINFFTFLFQSFIFSTNIVLKKKHFKNIIVFLQSKIQDHVQYLIRFLLIEDFDLILAILSTFEQFFSGFFFQQLFIFLFLNIFPNSESNTPCSEQALIVYNNRFLVKQFEIKLIDMKDISCVFQGVDDCGAIYISGFQSAKSIQSLKKLKIKAVISVASGAYLQYSKQDISEYLYIPAEDQKSFDIQSKFEETFQFIEKARKKTNILVHCMAGVSRSATIVAAYLIKKYRSSARYILALLQRKRRQIHPNAGFVKQLKQYQNKILTADNHVSKKENDPKSRKANIIVCSPKKNISFNPFEAKNGQQFLINTMLKLEDKSIKTRLKTQDKISRIKQKLVKQLSRGKDKIITNANQQSLGQLIPCKIYRALHKKLKTVL